MLPEAFLNRMNQMLGEEFSAFLASYDKPQFKALRLNPLKISCDTVFSSLKLDDLRPIAWKEAAYYYPEELAPGKHPLHEAGAYYIQEPSAMIPAELLAPNPGDRVLDLCAAPGGKSTQLAGKLDGIGFLVANEINASRARILSENIERLGIINALVTNEDSFALANHFPGFFTKIMVDAPCSGEGMFRKADIAVSEWSPENVENCAIRQDEILENAASMLSPGGELVYSTCTFAPIENEGTIYRFLKKHPEFHIVPAEERIPEIREMIPGSYGRPDWANIGCEYIDENHINDNNSDCGTDLDYNDSTLDSLKGTVRIWPHQADGEGHFAALLKKDGELSVVTPSPMGGFQLGISKSAEKGLAEYFSFIKETLAKDTIQQLELDQSQNLLLFGNNLYRMPENLPSLKGLKVLRTGLWLGTLKKNRFEPSHALALALKPSQVLHTTTLSLEDAQRFIGGQTLNIDGEKGWYLLTIDGISLGWGKLAGGILKNHYPKGLRK